MGNVVGSIEIDHLYTRIATVVDRARGAVARSINVAMVQANWEIGRAIVEVEQQGERRAEYGDELIVRLSKRLTDRFGTGFSESGLRRIRQFYLMFPNGSEIRSTLLTESAMPRAFSSSLSWSHYTRLMRIAHASARSFYETEASRESWSVRQLERQIAAQLFERLARTKSPSELAEGQAVTRPDDVIKDPFVLEFLDIHEPARLQERNLEQAIIDRLEAFMLELGKGFCFVGRQKRLTIEGDHFYVDLVFYNRLLRCFVLIDLKLEKLTHQDLGQMMMYVNYFDRTQRVEHEAKTVGIVLCSDVNQAMVKITLPEDNDQIRAATYQLYLPSEAELQAELSREREDAERHILASRAGDE
ncbi:MAG TPA: PDDEXK nuclease domain-containing protein [Kofleriaceae bacterium]|nr:PDDEXK nuclease domain-containing protein [Kofleriaceae bacterium]